jgi:hypothetical protein
MSYVVGSRSSLDALWQSLGVPRNESVLSRPEGTNLTRPDVSTTTGIPVSNLSRAQEDSIDLWVKSLTSGCHRVYSQSREEEEAFVQVIKDAVPGVELEKVSLLDIVNYFRPKSLIEGRQFFIQEYQDGRITDEDVKRIVAVVKQKRAEKGIDAIEEEEDRDEE